MQVDTTSSGASLFGGNATTTVGGAQNADLDTFLKLLTTQLKHQDPLSPADPSQFASDLANFSAVEQQTKTNKHLESLIANQRHADLVSLAGLIEREVDVRTSTLDYAGSALQFSREDGMPDQVRLHVYRPDGSELGDRVLSADPATNAYSWDGKINDQSLRAGSYTVLLQETASQSPADYTIPTVRSRVLGVQSSAEGNRLDIDAIGTVSPDHLTRVH